VRSVALQLSMLAVVLHVHVRGPGIDYVGVLVASGASWAGLPGPGEAALIAAGIAAAHHHLDLAPIVGVAWVGATAGGMLGWIVGMRGGRSLVTAPGPLHHARLAFTARGDRFYARYGVVAVLVTPSWVAGIHNMHWSRYVPVNAASALVWALAIAFAAYWIGPSITAIAADVGLGRWLIVAAAVAIVAAIVLRRRRAPHGGA